MNYKLSCYYDINTGKGAYSLEKSGREVGSRVIRVGTNSKQEGILSLLINSIGMLKINISHEDRLMIELQNASLCRELNGKQSNLVSNLLYDFQMSFDEVDCKYLFVYNPKPYAMNICKTKSNTIEGKSISELFKDI